MDSFPREPTLLLPETPARMYVLQVSCIIVKTMKLIMIFDLKEVCDGEIGNIHNNDEVILEVMLHPVAKILSIKSLECSSLLVSREEKTSLGPLSLCITAVTNDGNSIVHKS